MIRTSLFYTVFSFLVALMQVQSQTKDSIDAIAGFLKESDSRNIANYFAPVIEMNLLSDENEYSKTQAELILRDFLSKNKPITVKILHKVNSNSNYRFAVFIVHSIERKFRLSISLKKSDDSYYINLIRIEYDKD